MLFLSDRGVTGIETNNKIKRYQILKKKLKYIT